MCGLSASVLNGASLCPSGQGCSQKPIRQLQGKREPRSRETQKHFSVDLRCFRSTGGQLFQGSLLVLTERTPGNPKMASVLKQLLHRRPSILSKTGNHVQDHDVHPLWPPLPLQCQSFVDSVVDLSRARGICSISVKSQNTSTNKERRASRYSSPQNFLRTVEVTMSVAHDSLPHSNVRSS